MMDEGNDKEVKLLREDTIPSHSEHERKSFFQGRLLKTICDRLEVIMILPVLMSMDILNDNDTELIRNIVANKSSWEGAMEFLFILNRRSIYWYEGFILALVKTGQDDLARLLDETLTEKYLKDGDNACIDYGITELTSMSSVPSGVPYEFEKDPFALDLYENALEHGTEKEKYVRVNIVGNFNQGKTSLLRRLLGKSIDDVESTNGIDITKLLCKTNINGELLTLSDTLGSNDQIYYQRLLAIAKTSKPKPQELKGMNNTLLKSNQILTENRSTETDISEEYGENKGDEITVKTKLSNDLVFQSLKDIELPEISPTEQNSPTTLIALKQKSTLLTREQKLKLAEEANNEGIEAMESDNQCHFCFWDFGGQFSFYATHSLFHSRNAIYLLVFNLTTDLKSIIIDKDLPIKEDKRTMQYYFEYWMNSIHAFVGSENGEEPVVILVGTHKDELVGNKEEVQNGINRYFDDIRELFDGKDLCKHIYPHDFAVDNTSPDDPQLAALRNAILEIAEEKSKTIEIPARWIQLEKSMDEQKHLKIISFQQLQHMDSINEFPVGGVEEIKIFLRYHHGKGTCIYFDEPFLSDFIIIEPQFLVDAFKAIITCERFVRNEPSTVRPLWNKLLSEAKLERSLIDILWSKDEHLMKHKDILLMFLKKHNILSEVTHYDETTNTSSSLGWYIVPSFLKTVSPQEEIERFFCGKSKTFTTFVMKFTMSSIVHLVYHSLVAASIERWPIAVHVTKPMIFRNLCIVRLDQFHVGTIQLKSDCIDLFVANLCLKEVDRKQADRFRRFAQAVVNHEFQKLAKEKLNNSKSYEVFFRCNHDMHGLCGSYGTVPLEDLENDKAIPCPDLQSHVAVDSGMAAKYQWFTENNMKTLDTDFILTDKMLSNLSQHIGKEWKILGLQLGLSKIQIDHIVEENPNSGPMKRYRMLQKWHDTQGNDATMGRLVAVMRNCHKVDIEWNEIKNFIEDHITQEMHRNKTQQT